MTIQYELKENTSLTEGQIKELKTAASRPVVFDEDCPEITPDMFQKAYRPGRMRGGDMVSLRIQVSPSTLDKAKNFGENYIALLGQLLDEAVDRYSKG